MPHAKFDCMLCKEKHSIKVEDYGKHIMRLHEETVLLSSSMNEMTLATVKKNKIPYITINTNKKQIIPHKEAYLCLCCNQYYSQEASAQKHSHKDCDALTMHNIKLESYLEKYSDKVKYNINGSKKKEDIKNEPLPYATVYTMQPQASWTGATVMVEMIDHAATERNRLAYEAQKRKESQPEPVPQAEEKQPVAESAKTEGGIGTEFILKMMKESFNEFMIYEEERIQAMRFQNNIIDKFLANEDIDNDTIRIEKEGLEVPLNSMELEEAERMTLERICPKRMLKKLNMSYDELYNYVKSK